LLTSHHMVEVEQLANRIQITVQGKEIANGTVTEIATLSGLPAGAPLEDSYLALVNKAGVTSE